MPSVTHIFKTKGVGGCERLLLETLPELRKRGLDARAIVLQDPRKRAPEVIAAFRDAGVPLSSIDIRADWDPSATRGIVRALRASPPDLVHTHLVHADIHGTLAARLARVRHVVGSRHNLLLERRRNPAVRWASVLSTRAASRVITVSDAVSAATRTVERTPAAKVRRIYSGVRLPPPSCRRPRGVVGSACRLTEHKGLENLLQAWATMPPRPDERLLIAGTGPVRDRLDALANELGVTDSVELLGLVARMDAFYERLTVFVQPSRAEGLGLAAVEAASAGIPVIAANVGGLSEVVADGITGVLIEQDDRAALARSMRALLDDAATADRMGAEGRRLVGERFSFERMIDETLEVYSEVLTG